MIKIKTRILALLSITAILILPIASAQSNQYIVTPVSDKNLPESLGILSQGTITQGETDWFYQSIQNKKEIWVDLNWGDTSDSLTLTIYAPDGTVLGPYHDADDGSLDGRIFLHLSSQSGYLPSGTWWFKVYGEKVEGVEDYTFTVYS